MARAKVVVSRKWKNVEIKAFVNSEEVGAEQSLDDFIKALSIELSNPTTILPLILTKARLYAKLKLASDNVLAEMKQATKFVV